jgi:hypothetical protein
MILIYEQDDRLLFRYSSHHRGVSWIDDKLQGEGRVTIRRTFSFDVDTLVVEKDTDLGEDEEERVFVLAEAEGENFRIHKDILGLKYDLFLSMNMAIDEKTFIANRDISIFRKIDTLTDQPIMVGDDKDGSIPITEFEELLRNFPTSTELTHYASSRISRVLKDYMGTMSDAQSRLDKYLRKNQSIRARSQTASLKEYELEKYTFVHDSLVGMLHDSESYSEQDWQNLIVEFLLLIFPQYVAILNKIQIKDFYSNRGKTTDRFPDLSVVDANGNIGIIEIKKPFPNCLLSSSKYRDNYTPKKELSGAVMQVEKYLFHLSKWGVDGEKQLTKKWRDDLPEDMEIRITNPKAMIILGRDNDFIDDQRFDFEIIKRKYANIVEIMTYDDLLRRLVNIRSMLSNNYAKIDATMKKVSGLGTKKT